MPLPRNMITATYRKTGIKGYEGNPLIEALPPTLPIEHLTKVLRGEVEFDPKDIYADDRKRAHIISSLLHDFFQPLPVHLQLEEKLSIMIRRGYVGRNLLDGSLNAHMQNGYERVLTGDLETFRFAHTESTALSLSLIGCSGSGKSTTLTRILATYPQVIYHEQYNHMQVTYLKVDCPHDGSLKSLCIQFFRALDKVLHTDYETKYTRKRHSIETLLALMSQTANAYTLGVLVIDEIQHLSRKHSGGVDKMLNFFVTLVNVIGLPVVFVGTPKARPIFESDLRSARRSAGFGSLLWEPMRGKAFTENPVTGEKTKLEWGEFSEKLWKYQWLRRRDEMLSEEIRDCWYDRSQGVLDIVVKLFVLAQLRAIVTGVERITPQLLKQVYDDELAPIHPMLAALRSGDPERIARYSDLPLPNTDQRLLDLTSAIEAARSQKATEFSAFADNPKAERLHNLLVGMDYSSDQVTPLVEKAFAEYPDLTIEELLPIIWKWSKQPASSPAPKPKVIPKSKWHTLPSDDLRYVFSQADDTSVYDRLQKNSVIFDMESWLESGG